jgi:hypothetical protein
MEMLLALIERPVGYTAASLQSAGWDLLDAEECAYLERANP